jgi:hypothetical protein
MRRSKSVGQLALLPQPGSEKEGEQPVQRVWLVSVADELKPERRLPTRLVRVDPTLALRFLPEWELVAARVIAPLRVGTEEPSAEGRRVLALTLADELIEQDPDGGLWLDGERLQAGPLVSFAALGPDWEQQLCLGRRTAWLLASRTADAFAFTVRVSEPLLWVFDNPRPLTSVPTFDGWINAARQLAQAVRTVDERFVGITVPAWRK